MWGYRKHWQRSGEVFDLAEIEMPPLRYDTVAMWSDVDAGVKEVVEAAGCNFLGGLHGAGHAALAVLPLFLLCDRGDVGTECPSPLQRRARPLRVVLYDTRPGGTGASKHAVRHAAEVWRQALDLVYRCSCQSGCPACLHDPACREYNHVVDKKATLLVLRAIVQRFEGEEEG